MPPIPTRKPPLPWSQLPPGRSATTCWVLRTLGFGEEYRGNILFKHTAGIRGAPGPHSRLRVFGDSFISVPWASGLSPCF